MITPSDSLEELGNLLALPESCQTSTSTIPSLFSARKQLTSSAARQFTILARLPATVYRLTHARFFRLTLARMGKTAPALFEGRRDRSSLFPIGRLRSPRSATIHKTVGESSSGNSALDWNGTTACRILPETARAAAIASSFSGWRTRASFSTSCYRPQLSGRRLPRQQPRHDWPPGRRPAGIRDD